MAQVQHADRVQPHSLEAEQATLGAILLRDEMWSDVAQLLAPSDFYRDAHMLVWDAIVALKMRGVRADLLTVREELMRTGRMDAVGQGYLSSLVDGVPRSTNVEHYAAIVKEKARLRGIIIAAEDAQARAYDGAQSDEVAEGAIKALTLTAPSGRTEQSLDAALAAYLGTLDGAPEETITTGMADIDDQLAGGLRRKELVIVAARPSVGKTSFALGAAYAAAGAGFPSAFVSVEMPVRALVSRMVAWESRVPLSHLRSRTTMSERDRGLISQGVGKSLGRPLVLDEVANSMIALAALASRLKQRAEGLALLVVDYLQLLVHDSHGDRQQQAVAAVSRGLKRLAKEHDIAVMALSQLSRAPEGRKDKRPMLADLRDSGALEQDADVAVLLFREEMHSPSDENAGVAEAIIAKNRNGPVGVRKLTFMQDYTWFTDMAQTF